MAVNRIILNETSYFGAGARRVLADEIRSRNYSKAFVVTDKDLIRFGVAGKVTACWTRPESPMNFSAT